MRADRCDERQLLKVTGTDRESFLQGLVTNDVAGLSTGLVYAALLTPQGKYLADFFLVPSDNAILIDVHISLGSTLLTRLSMYKLRADVQIETVDMPVFCGLGDQPAGALTDPRDKKLGWRFYGELSVEPANVDWTALRVTHIIPATNIELQPNQSFILEMGFERLNGVNFRKGCYVGQEVTARMKHKTELGKGLARVAVTKDVPVGTDIEAAGKLVGTVYSQADGRGLAYVRFNRASDDMNAGDATVALSS